MNKSIVVLIAGGTGSGKSTLAKKIKRESDSTITIVSLDNYYKDQGHLSIEERAKINYDSPDVLDFELLLKNITNLKNGLNVIEPRYDFKTHTRQPNNIITYSQQIVLVEGILSLFNERIRELSDLNLYVDVADDERILRRILRDVVERGRTVESVIEQYRTSVKPMHIFYVEPTKQFADFVVQNNDARTVYYILDLIRSLYTRQNG